MNIHFDNLSGSLYLNIKYYKIFKINILDVNFSLFTSSSQSFQIYKIFYSSYIFT